MSDPFKDIEFKLDKLLKHVEQIEKYNKDLQGMLELKSNALIKIYEQSYKNVKENKRLKEALKNSLSTDELEKKTTGTKKESKQDEA